MKSMYLFITVIYFPRNVTSCAPKPADFISWRASMVSAVVKLMGSMIKLLRLQIELFVPKTHVLCVYVYVNCNCIVQFALN